MSNSKAKPEHETVEILRASGISKSYFAGKRELPVLKEIDLTLKSSEVLMICGPSGAGKSTLLHILGLLDPPTGGALLYRGENILSASQGRKAFIRNRKFGFVFQFYHLLPDLNVIENTCLPLMIRESVISWLPARRRYREKVQSTLASMGLSERMKHRPSQLSGGERQRVAIARAIVTDPDVLFCDEPTGNLDTKTAGEILEVLWKIKDDFNQTLIVVTHNKELASKGTRQLDMIDGKLYHPGEREPAPKHTD
jgi:lipoprotein-releasing system ATP-binding protein